MKSYSEILTTVSRPISLCTLLLAFLLPLAMARGDELGVTVTPPEGWKKESISVAIDGLGKVEGLGFMLLDNSSNARHPEIGILSIKLSDQIPDLAAYIEAEKSQGQKSHLAYKLIEISNNVAANNGSDARYFDLYAFFKDGDTSREFWAVYDRPDEQRLVVFKYGSSIERYDELLPLAKETLASLQISAPLFVDLGGISVNPPLKWRVEGPRFIDDMMDIGFTIPDDPDYTTIAINAIPISNKIPNTRAYIKSEKLRYEKDYLSFKVLDSSKHLTAPIANTNEKHFDVYGSLKDGDITHGFWVVFERPEENRLVVFKFESSIEGFDEHLAIAKKTLASLRISPLPNSETGVLKGSEYNSPAQTEEAITIEKPMVVPPDDMPADINHAILAIVKTVRGELSDGLMSNANAERNFTLDDVEFYQRSTVIGYRLNAILENPESKLGRKIAGRIFFQDEYQLGATIEFAAEYSGQSNGNREVSWNLNKIFAQLVTPENPRIRTFLAPAGGLPNSEGQANSISEFLDWFLPVVIDPSKVDQNTSAIKAYAVISIFLDKMPKGEEIDLRIAYGLKGFVYKPPWLINKNFDGWHTVVGVEWMNLVDGPAKYFAFYHKRNNAPLELVHAFTPVAGGRRLVTEKSAGAFPDKKPVDLNWKIFPDSFAEKGFLGLLMKEDGLVDRVILDSPAYIAGINVGDTISAINGKTVLGDLMKALEDAQVIVGRETEIVYFSNAEDRVKYVIVMPEELQ